MKYRAVFLSDVHLGTKWCRAKGLSSFLSGIECEKFYLVGDIIDGWKLKRKPGWPHSHNAVIRKILKLSKKADVQYIVGNHDEFLSEFDGYSFGGVTICRRARHKGLDGREYLVVHGHEYDGAAFSNTRLAHLGDRAYDLSLSLNLWLDRIRSLLGLGYWSLSDFLKRKVKDAVKYIGHYELCVLRSVRESGADGIICGHIHSPAIRELQGIRYLNCGDWVENCTALVENLDGTMEILRWPERAAPKEGDEAVVFLDQPLPVPPAEVA